MEQPAKATVIIIGGGIAGLVAARALADYYHVVVLEANERLGGRIYSYKESGFTQPIEGGAEFIHGKTKHTMELLKEANIPYEKLEGKMYRKENGQWQEQEGMIEHWDSLLKKMKDQKEDITMLDFLQQHYSGMAYTEFRKHVTAYTEGFDLADVSKVSVHSLYKEWSHEDEQYRVDGGYGALIQYLTDDCTAKGCDILTNTIVKQIDWEANDVTIYTNDELRYYAEKCIITIPIAILQKDMAKMAINITPPVHDYIAATRKIGTGKVIKVVLQFSQVFWQSELGFVFSNEIFPTWWTIPNAPILTGWIGGPNAAAISDDTDDVLMRKALSSVASIFDMPIERVHEYLQAGKVFNWQKEHTSLHGYCYTTPAGKQAYALLTTPLLDTVYFAGEGIYDGPFPGTVEAAIVSAKNAVKQLLKA